MPAAPTDEQKIREYDGLYELATKQKREIEELRKRLAKHEPQKIANINIAFDFSDSLSYIFDDERMYTASANEVLREIKHRGVLSFLKDLERDQDPEITISICEEPKR